MDKDAVPAPEPKGLFITYTTPSPSPESISWDGIQYISALTCALPAVRSAVSYSPAPRLIDGETHLGSKAETNWPAHAAVLDLDDIDVIKDNAYSHLLKIDDNANSHLAHYEWRAYRLNENTPVRVSDTFMGYEDGNGGPGRTRISMLVSMDVDSADEAGFHRWYDEEHVPLITRIPGWLRSRRFILVDHSIVVGGGHPTNPDPKSSLSEEYIRKPPRFLAVHDYAHEDGMDSPEHRACALTPWRDEVMAKVAKYEKRLWSEKSVARFRRLTARC